MATTGKSSPNQSMADNSLLNPAAREFVSKKLQTRAHQGLNVNAPVFVPHKTQVAANSCLDPEAPEFVPSVYLWPVDNGSEGLSGGVQVVNLYTGFGDKTTISRLITESAPLPRLKLTAVEILTMDGFWLKTWAYIATPYLQVNLETGDASLCFY